MLHVKQFLGVKLEQNVDTTEWHDDKIKISRHSLIINKIIKSATLKSFFESKGLFIKPFHQCWHVYYFIKCKFIYLPFMGNWSIGTLLKRR